MHTVKLLWIFLCIFRWIYDKMLNPDRGLCCSPIHSYILELAQRMNEQLNWIANQSGGKASRKLDYSMRSSVFTIAYHYKDAFTIRFKCTSSVCIVNLDHIQKVCVFTQLTRCFTFLWCLSFDFTMLSVVFITCTTSHMNSESLCY